MNLELLDPFGRQVPDRVDATIQLADSLHFPPQQRRSSLTATKSNKRGRDYDEDDEDDDDDEENDVNEDLDESTNSEILKRIRSSKQTGRQRRNAEKYSANEMDCDDDEEWKAAYHVAYNRRGTYLAVGYGSGTVAVFSTLTRSLSALYYSDNNHTKSKLGTTNKSKGNKVTSKYSSGCSSLSWARRSRRLLIGSFGDDRVKLYDTTHPLGSEDCASAAAILVSAGQTANASSNADQDDNDNDSTTEKETKPKSKESTALLSRHILMASPGSSSNIIQPVHPTWKGAFSPFAVNEDDKRYTFVRQTLRLSTKVLEPGITSISESGGDNMQRNSMTNKQTRYPCVSFQFQHSVVGSLHLHPRYPHTGISVLSDGSLVIFCVPYTSGFVHEEMDANTALSSDLDDIKPSNLDSVRIIPLYTKQMVQCASFDSLGNHIYAVTKAGTLLGFDIAGIWKTFFVKDNVNLQLPVLEPSVVIPRNSSSKSGDTITHSSTGTTIWHLIVSRNGKFLIINSSDGTIKLYNTSEFWSSNTKIDSEYSNSRSIKPTWTFQDVVTKVKFASCDLSGDGEYVVGGANGADNKYELHIWNTSTGALMDKLTGASTKLYSVAWHPTRSFLAVACADGLVDVWGPRINWTAFAPDFQALPMNVEYIEREDEFDVDENGRHLAEGYYVRNETSDSIESETTPINVTNIERVPVFASDSEEEEDVFEFETRVKNLLAGRLAEGKIKDKKGISDD